MNPKVFNTRPAHRRTSHLLHSLDRYHTVLLGESQERVIPYQSHTTVPILCEAPEFDHWTQIKAKFTRNQPLIGRELETTQTDFNKPSKVTSSNCRPQNTSINLRHNYLGTVHTTCTHSPALQHISQKPLLKTAPFAQLSEPFSIPSQPYLQLPCSPTTPCGNVKWTALKEDKVLFFKVLKNVYISVR